MSNNRFFRHHCRTIRNSLFTGEAASGCERCGYPLKQHRETEHMELPILFSAQLVREIMAGRKNVTRRIVKPKPPHQPSYVSDRIWIATDERESTKKVWTRACPYGKAGDRLWVRENGWQRPQTLTSQLLRDGADTWPEWMFDADDIDHDWCRDNKWIRRPSIHMPRRVARLTLTVRRVHVEPLQNITEAQAVAEGFRPTKTMSAFDQFREVWCEINGEKSWRANPLVWCVAFTKDAIAESVVAA